MYIRFYISQTFISIYYRFLILHFSNGESYVALILKSNGSITKFIRFSEFNSLYRLGNYDIMPIGV